MERHALRGVSVGTGPVMLKLTVFLDCRKAEELRATDMYDDDDHVGSEGASNPEDIF
uniref:Uncharacterized protein n=1 Tax=Setaria digitata TaxID=48799 RepID=A0A915PV41_9BILA